MLKLAVPALVLAALSARADEGVRVLVGFHGKPDAQVFRKHGGRSELVLGSAVSGTLSAAACARVQSLPEVAYVVEDAVAEAQGKPAGGSGQPSPQPAQSTPWGVHRIGADLVALQGQGVRVAVVDTGIDNSHPDFKDASGASRIVLGATFVSGTRSAKDDHDHGTHVAGTIGASNNGIGVVGVAPGCTPVAVKVLDRSGSGYYSWIIAGIDWAVANACPLISMSLGGSSDVAELRDACDRAAAAGVVVVAAAGNSGNAVPQYPGAYASVIAVAATDSADQRASFSTYGSQLDLAAPGVGVLSTVRKGGYATWNGTSMATPHVSGTAALAIASGRHADLRAALEATADDLNAVTDLGWDPYLGSGLVDAEEAATGLQTLP